jgi:hypothetical protein
MVATDTHTRGRFYRYVDEADHDAAMAEKDAEIEELRRDMRLCRGHDIVAKFRVLSAERDDMLDKLIAAKAEIADWQKRTEDRAMKLDAALAKVGEKDAEIARLRETKGEL